MSALEEGELSRRIAEGRARLDEANAREATLQVRVRLGLG
jgi:hypothetical protein